MGEWAMTDAARVEELLKPHELVVAKVQALLFWRNPVGMVVLLVTVNLVFLVVYMLNLSFVSTVFLLLALKVLLEDRALLQWLFPEVDSASGGVRRIFSLAEVSQFVAKIARAMRVVLPRQRPSLVAGIVPIGVLLALFVFFRFTGTFWVNFVVVNLTLLLPAALLHPKVLPYVKRAVAAITY
jgi:hypothetical protein